MSKIKRKITVNLTTKSKTVTKTRPSVFERLGTKATTTVKEYCHHWAQSGSCPYGKGCKYSVTHTLISPSKQRAAKTQSIPTKRRHAKDGHKRPPQQQKPPQTHEEWEQWDPDELEDADPDDLEKRRQELQRELEIQMKMENKAKKKDKKVKKDSSPSSESSSSSSESSSSSDESSSSSSSSAEARHKKVKKPKMNRNTSSSSEERARNKHKLKAKRNSSKSATREKQPKKCVKPVIKTKSPSPTRPRKKSETPPLKVKSTSKKLSTEKSPRPQSRTSVKSSTKEKHRTPSPKPSKEKEREKEREREREREKEKEREREREREREKEKEREREREKERERERAKERAKEREREKEKEYKKKEATRSPKRDSRTTKDTRKMDTPDSSHSRDRKVSPGRGKPNTSRRDHKSPAKDDRRSDKRDDRGRSRGKDTRSSGCDKSRPKDSGSGSSKRDSRDRDRERERERERRLAREEREAAREKEREEALARCQERQRERERLKELQKKEEEQRRRERSRRDDRGLDKPSGDRVERLLPPLEERVPPSRKAHSSERERSDRNRVSDRHDRRSPEHSSRKSVDRRSDLDKDRSYDRGYDRNRDREHERVDRDYSGGHRGDREKDYGSPYERNARHDDRRYMDIDDHYVDGVRDDARLYGDDRRGRRDLWDMREDPERDRELDHRQRYGRDDSLKGGREGDWDREYPAAEHDWGNDRNRRPIEWDNRDTWDSLDHKQVEEEWRHYNRSMDSWATDDRRRWQGDWRERERERERSRPRSSASHHIDTISTSIPPSEDSNLESRRKEPTLVSVPRQELLETKPAPSVSDAVDSGVLKDSTSLKRPAEEDMDSSNATKKVCVKAETQPVLEDDLSEISDDADEILNRDEEIQEFMEEGPASIAQPEPSTVDTASLKDQNTSTTSQKSQSPPPKSPSKTVLKEESIDEENMDLDFEEISEDELEEESKVKGLGDALGVDWASLVAESRPRSKPMSSAKLRWESHNVLVHLGVSVALAGEDMVKNILKEHAEAEQRQQQVDSLKTEDVGIKIKEEPQEMLNGIKQEPKEEESKPYLETEEKEVVISHPIAMIQVADREKQAMRKALFTGVGAHRRALAARRDLTLRRHLSNLPMTDVYVEAPKRHDPELLKVATQLFERCL